MKLFIDSKNLKFVVVSSLMGIITTFFAYRDFGAGDHIEHLPLIYRCIDSQYLINDFFVNAGESSFARLFYAKFIGGISGCEANLPSVFFLFTVLVNVAISVITYCFAKRMFHNSSTSGLFASAAVMFVSTFSLGWNPAIFHETLLPASIAVPLLLGAIWAIAEKKIMLAAVLCILAIIIHPLMGLEMSAVIFFACVILLFIEKNLIRRHLKQTIVSISAILLLAIILLHKEFSGFSLSSDKFIYILAYFRHPHHYLPSSFAAEDYWQGIVFLLSVFVAFFFLKQPNSRYDTVLGTIIISILLLCVGGYVFVEVVPLKLWTIAQTFRLLYFVKWLGIVVIAGSIPRMKLSGLMKLLYLLALVNPFTTIFAITSQAILSNIKMGLNKSIINATVFFVMFLWVIWMDINIDISHIALILLCVAILDDFLKRIILRVLLPSIFVLVLILVLTRHSNQYSRLWVNTTAGKIMKTKYNFVFRPGYDLNGSEIVSYVKKNTSPQSVFLTPPLWGQFRFVAKRAIVVDFKAFPFSELAMDEWYSRIINCYGNPKGTGFGMINELYNNYAAIDDKSLLRLSKSYGFSYAVLDNNTNTSFEVICSDKGYKLVRIL